MLSRKPDQGRIDAVKDVINKICALLDRFGEDDKVEWLVIRLNVLESVDSGNDEVVETFHEIHGVVLGMGGLMDLYLQGDAVEETVDANAELRRLADQVYELTR
jgi:hypothetical protein